MAIKKVYVAMSGGVDSAVAAYLLKKRGYHVTGVYMKNWSDPLADVCPWEKDIKDFYNTCKVLKIPSKIEIFEEEYRKKVVNYLVNGYKQGITPNPDMLCNREIKFKLFLRKAMSQGADMIATGHYVIKKDYKKIPNLYQSKDENKDQSYFLALLNQNQIKHSLFPIGNFTKDKVRKIAKQANLPVFDKKDSQGICFIGKVKFSDFIRDFIPNKLGDIITTDGNVIGKHDGVYYYTIGQRHGLNIGGGIPYFVVEKNIKKNVLIVAKGDKEKSLLSNQADIINFNWIDKRDIKEVKACKVRVRYRQPLQGCNIKVNHSDVIIKFNKQQKAVTPGQFAVLYKNKRILGGGVII